MPAPPSSSRVDQAHAQAGPSETPLGRLVPGIGLLSAAMLGLEMLAIRWISILYYPLAAYIVIALALMGLGIRGGVLAVRGDRPLRPAVLPSGLRHHSPLKMIEPTTVASRLAKSPWLAVG